MSDGLVAVREASPDRLVVLPFDDPAHAQVVVAPPASWPALMPSEAATLHRYFHWDAVESFWWRTQYPAVFSLEHITGTLWAGHLQTPGHVVAAGDDPKRRPMDVDNVFGVYQESTPGTIRDPLGPETIRDPTNRSVEVYRARSVRMVLARFPAFGPERVWLRLFVQATVRDSHRTALDEELTALRQLRACDRDCAVEVLHEGVLDVANYAGRYVAVRPPVGIRLHDLFQGNNDDRLVGRAELVRQVLLDVAAVMLFAHSSNPPFCLGPISPTLLSVRPVSAARSRVSVRATFVALPAAGASGRTVSPDVLQLFPDGEPPFLTEQLRPRYSRSIFADLRSLGYFLRELSDLARVQTRALSHLTKQLLDGQIRSVREAVAVIDPVSQVDS